MPKSFGAAFREAREQAGFSVERAAVATRISASFIEALEQQKFKVLPGEIFGRGFVRNLCRAYGCDAKPLVAAYDLAISSQSGETLTEAQREVKTKNSRINTVAAVPKGPSIDTEALKQNLASAWKVARPVVIAIPVLLGVLWIGQTAYQSYKSSASKTEPLESTADVVQAPATPAPAVTPAPAPAATPPATAETKAPAIVKGEGAEFVDITVKEAVQVRFGRDKDKQIIEVLQPQTYRFQFNEQLRLLVNDMSVVEIRFKDQIVPNKGVKGEARYMTFAVSDSALAKNREKAKL